MSAVKTALMELARRLPEEATWDEVMYQIYVLKKIDEGLKDADEGRTAAHEDVFHEFSYHHGRTRRPSDNPTPPL